jgi:hypothetical protein
MPPAPPPPPARTAPYGAGQSNETTLIKKKKIFSIIYKEIQNRAVAKSYMTNGLLIYGEIFASYFRKPFLIYDFATAAL